MAKTESTKSTYFPPVVTVLGHVDHGKTTLLDAIRKTSIATREHGGITQKIGASSVEIMHEGQKRRITFIDTPGHEAFSKMRTRGTQAADIGILVVSVVDGVMPQTRESIELLKQTETPFIVALTKADAEAKQPEKVKQQLLKEGVLLEGLGGEVPYIEVSAKTGLHVKELLDLVLLLSEVNDMLVKRSAEKSSQSPLRAIVIESRLDQKAGPKATVVIKNGMLSQRDEIVSGTISGKVRALIDDKGKILKTATVGDAVEVLGFETAPAVGSDVVRKGHAVAAMVEKPIEKQAPLTAADFFQKPEDGSKLSIILVTDTLGSLEAILAALPEKVVVISQKAGEISEADVLLAKSVGAFVIGFNTKLRSEVSQLAITEKVLMKNYTIIYELLDEITDVLEGKKLALEEKIYGVAKILASFPFEKTKVCGIQVIDGRVAKGDTVRIMRGDDTIGEASIVSVRQGKNQTSKVEKGQEAGIIISPLLDFTIGDMVICHG